MALKNTAQLLFDISKGGNKKHFLSFVKRSSILTMSPDYALPKDISLLIISFATIKISDEHYWKTLEKYFHNKKDEMNAHDFASCLWGFAKSPKLLLHQSTWRSLEAGVTQNLNNFNTKELANICYSFAALDNYSPTLWNMLKLATIRQMNEMHVFDIPSLIWSFSKANITDERVWLIFEKKVILEIKNLSPDLLGNIMYGFAKQGKGSENLWNLFENVVLSKIDELESKNMMNIICSFNKMGKGRELFWGEITEKLQADLKGYSIPVAINSLCALSKESHTNIEMNSLIEQTLCGGEKIQEMSYGNMVNLVRLLYAEKFNKPEIWDRIVVRMRQLIPEVSYFNLQTYAFLISVNPVYWNFVCEESVLAFFDKLSKGDYRIRERNNPFEDLHDMIDLAWLCLYQKIGSFYFWKELARYFQSQDFNIHNVSPISIAKYMQVVSRRFQQKEILKDKWLEFEDDLYNNLVLFKRYANDPRAITLVFQACFFVDRQEKILERFESVYESLEWKPKDIVDMLYKVKTEKNGGKNKARIHKVMAKDEFGKLDPEIQVELWKGQCEAWFNQYLERDYPIRPLYQEMIIKEAQKKFNREIVKEKVDEELELEDAKEVFSAEVEEQEFTLELDEPLLKIENDLVLENNIVESALVGIEQRVL